MSKLLDKQSIIKKTMEVGSSTLLSRLLGLFREVLKGLFLGTNALADAFVVAFMIPNSLRKIFAEGALTAAFVPTIVTLAKDDNQKEVDALMTLSFLIFEGILAVTCLLMFWQAEFVVRLAASGFSPEKIAITADLFRIMSSFILFVSSSSLLAGALQSVNHFLIPALGPVLLNVIFIGALLACLWFNLPVTYLCYAILFAGVANFVMHLIVYFKKGFGFTAITPHAKAQFGTLLKKFFPVMFSMSIMEISLFIDTSFSSYLADGSVSIINYANRFMGIPLGIFAAAFSTILLPYFAQVSVYEPKKLSYYLFEASKLVMWVTVPVAILMGFFSEDIFRTLFLSDKFPLVKVLEAKWVLMGFLAGLFFFSLNKIILNVYYALHDTYTPMMISIVAMLANFVLNKFLVGYWQATGLAVATSISGLIQVVLFIYFLRSQYGFDFHLAPFKHFLPRFIAQTATLFALFMTAFVLCKWFILGYLADFSFWSVPMPVFLLEKLGLWLWVGPLSLLLVLGFLKTRRHFGIELYFID